MPTNPFTTAGRRQQILVPKELFPRKSNHNGGDISMSSAAYRRPVKLPLRKHHSFHFQPSQTVAGVIKHEQFQQKHSNHPQISTKERYKSQGPLVFKPFSEKSAFKPIVPSPKDSNDSEDGNAEPNTRNEFEASTMPRICGTSLKQGLKRHISNVETFSTTNQWQSDNEDSFPTNATSTSAASASTVNRRKIHYADLAPLPAANINSVHHRNDRNNNSNSDNIDSSGDNSSSERQMTADATNNGDQKQMNIQPSTATSATTTTKTQYATLRFDEVSI